MSRIFVITTLIICASLSALTQDVVTGAFEGRVVNAQTGAPISGASVQMINQATGVPLDKRTDADGHFFQGMLPPGTYTIRISAPGFKTMEVEQRMMVTRSNAVLPTPLMLEPEGVVSTGSPAPSSSSSKGNIVPAGNAEMSVAQTERAFLEALKRGDTKVLERLLADKFKLTNSRGVVMNRSRIIADIVSGNWMYQSLEAEADEVSVYNDAAVITGRLTARGEYKGQDISGQFRYTALYVKQQGRWQLAASQETRIP